MLNLKLKSSLLALSISTALIAPQIASAAPYKILPLGDSITNGIYNGGNALAYRDDLHLKLKAGNYSYEFAGKCPTFSENDETGECDQLSLYSKGVINEPATSGAVFLHEGRAGWHADRLLSRLPDLLPWYGGVDAVLLHIGTNDIYVQADDDNKTDSVVEAITYTTTFDEIKAIVTGTHELLGPDVKIYLAKILPMGKVQKTALDGTTSDVTVTADIAKGLNDLIQAHPWGANVVVVNQNFGGITTSTLNSDLVHPNRAGENGMALRWYNAFIGDFAANGASEKKSVLTTDKATLTANDTEVATITLQAKDSEGENLTTGGDTVTIFNAALVVSPVVDNGDGTYTSTVKRPSGVAGAVTVRAKINNKQLTDTEVLTFLAGQKITFTPPATAPLSNVEFPLTATSSSGLIVTLTAVDTSVCTVDDNKKVKLLKVGDCTLTASQAGGTASSITYGAATPVEKTIVIGKGTQIITFDASTPSTGFIGSSFVPKASSTSGLAVVFTAAPNAVCSIVSNKVTFKSAGTCKVIASQAGDANYSTASVVTNITVSDDKITLPTIAAKTVGDKAFTVTAKSSSGAAVTLTASPANVCTVSGSQVSIGKSSGTCTLSATTDNGSATTTFTVKKNASQLAIDSVTKVINGSGSITVAQLEPIKGLKNLKNGTNYTKALKAGTYADKNNPTVTELQAVVDKVNKDNNKSGGSTSPAWLLMLGFVALFRRKQQL